MKKLNSRSGSQIKSTLALLASIMILISCAPRGYTYSKPGATDQEYAEADYRCTKENMTNSGSVYRVDPNTGLIIGGSSRRLNMKLWKRCMEARGFTVKRESNSSQKSTSNASTTRSYTPRPNDLVWCANKHGVFKLTRENCQEVGGDAYWLEDRAKAVQKHNALN